MWEVLADRWLSGRRTRQAETDLRWLAAGDREAHRHLAGPGGWRRRGSWHQELGHSPHGALVGPQGKSLGHKAASD